jgi:hypothetical protein
METRQRMGNPNGRQTRRPTSPAPQRFVMPLSVRLVIQPVDALVSGFVNRGEQIDSSRFVPSPDSSCAYFSQRCAISHCNLRP